MDHGLAVRCRQDVELVQAVRMVAALAFVPVNDVNILAENLDADLQPILVHMEDKYLDHMRRGHFRAARFPMAMWNVHDMVLDNLPNTNNSVEGWRHAFAASCGGGGGGGGGHHLDFWKFINVLKNEEDLTRVMLIHIQQGCAAPRPHPVYGAINERIVNVVRYANRDVLEYLRNCS